MTWVVIGVVGWVVVVGWTLLFLKGGTDWEDWDETSDFGQTAERSSPEMLRRERSTVAS